MFKFLRPPPQRPSARPSPAPLRAGDADPARQREPARERDGLLTGLARTWLHSLPAPSRPNELCARYPRLANRLALGWGDHRLAGHLLEDLLVDRRGTRKGFPSAVASELMRLRQLHDRQRPDDDLPTSWDVQSLIPSDR